MKAMRKVSRGSSFRGVLDYNRKNKLIGGNMFSRSIRGLATEFGMLRRRRPDIVKPVWHQALRLPKGEQQSEAQWLSIVQEYLHRLGLNDSHQYAVFLEDDVEGQHVHIVANRISASGQVYLGRNENLATTRICSELERKFGLRVTPEATADESGHIRQPDRRSVTSRELQKAVRADEVPARIVLQQLIEKAWTGRPATEQFVDRLAGDGVRIVPNVASTGRVSGMRFSIDGELWFSGSQLGAAYKWLALCERIDYDKDRDAQCLGDLKDANTSVATSRDVGDAAPGADAIASRELEPNDPAEPAPGWDGGGNGAAVANCESLGAVPGRDSGCGQIDPETSAAGTSSDPVHADSTDNSSGDSGMGTSHSVEARPRDRHGNINTAIGSGAEKAVARPTWLDHQLAAVKRMERALGAPLYRVTARDRVAVSGPGRTHVLHPEHRRVTDADRKNGEPYWQPNQLAAWVSSGAAAAMNARRFDIYITPMDPDHHYLLVDDVKGLEGVKAMRRLGYRPALVQRTSDGNYQVILKVRKTVFAREAEAANRVVQRLNRNFGDPKVSGGQHAFRLAGLRNKKPGRGDATVEIDWGESSPGLICRRATTELEIERSSLTALAGHTSPAAVISANPQQSSVAGPADGQRYAALFAGIERRFARGDGVIDRSAVDYRTAVSLLQEGWSADRVGEAMRSGSPELAVRHTGVDDYVTRTVAAAQRAVQQRKARHHPPRPKGLGGPSIA
jgi:hypothetical protein